MKLTTNNEKEIIYDLLNNKQDKEYKNDIKKKLEFIKKNKTVRK